jgi:hypothetical protein
MSRLARIAIVVSVSLIIPCLAAERVRAADECCPPLATADSPIRYFDGNSFSFLSPCPSVSCYPSYAVPNAYPQVSTSYYTPGFYSSSYSAKIVPPPYSSNRNPTPWPYYYTPAGDYTPGYYSYYYTPGYFRY